MRRPHLRSGLQRLFNWGALAIGCGGLLAADATAERVGMPPVPAALPQQRDVRLATVSMRLEGETIYISERGGGFEPLPLGDSLQAAQLRRLLAEAGAGERAVSVPVGSMIVANGGAAGDGKKPKAPDADTSDKKPPKAKAKAKTKEPPKSTPGGK
jgi:hypothetical protein